MPSKTEESLLIMAQQQSQDWRLESNWKTKTGACCNTKHATITYYIKGVRCHGTQGDWEPRFKDPGLDFLELLGMDPFLDGNCIADVSINESGNLMLTFP